MGFLSDVFDSVSGTAGALLGAGQDVSNAQNAQKRQAGINERQYRNRYQWQMEDMRLAGLNPILSYKQGAPGMPGVGGYTSDFSGAVTRGVSSAAAAKQASTARRVGEAQIGNLAADTVLKGSQSEAARQAALLSNSARRLNEISAFMAGPDILGTEGVMAALNSMGTGGDVITAINRMRVLLGLSYSPGRGGGGWGVRKSRGRSK